jgi:hypothetical protein
MMYAKADYAQPLRAIGQALETLNIQAFEMEPADEVFFVRGAKPSNGAGIVQSQISIDKLQTIWGSVPEQNIWPGAHQREKTPNAISQIELHYTSHDVERLESEGRARRGTAKMMSDTPSLSQLLRCIGAYLTQKLARLQKLSWAGDSLSVVYETSLGSRIQETLAASDLYDLWVRMYLQRASRVASQ